jgi:hypothetical protein
MHRVGKCGGHPTLSITSPHPPTNAIRQTSKRAGIQAGGQPARNDRKQAERRGDTGSTHGSRLRKSRQAEISAGKHADIEQVDMKTSDTSSAPPASQAARSEAYPPVCLTLVESAQAQFVTCSSKRAQ